jgi:glycosyltransferase involved in cell wall biosynthesis
MEMNKDRVTLLSLLGMLSVVLGIVLYVIASVLGLLRAILFGGVISKHFIETILWYSPLPIIVGIVLFLMGLATVARKRHDRQLMDKPFSDQKVTVALTAYNDESSIAGAVEDFLKHPRVENVIVISNNSSDSTFDVAQTAGAIVYNEEKQGYGACVHRAMTEACSLDQSGTVVICEGDLTFRANDLEKMLPYLEHADVVNGTRIVESLQANSTQFSMFMHYGNLFVAKLLEVKYLGDVSLTDVGTTYKIARTECLRSLIPDLDNDVNLTFNPYFLENVVSRNYKLVEVPITFHPRVGVSKGGNISNSVALKLGFKMMVGIIFGWKYAK